MNFAPWVTKAGRYEKSLDTSTITTSINLFIMSVVKIYSIKYKTTYDNLGKFAEYSNHTKVGNES